MNTAKQKVSDTAAVAKEHVDIMKAKAQEKAETATARSKEEREIAHEMGKARVAEAKMKMHEAKAEHAQEKLNKKHRGGPLNTHATHLGGHREPVVPATGHVAPTHPLGGQHTTTGWTGHK